MKRTSPIDQALKGQRQQPTAVPAATANGKPPPDAQGAAKKPDTIAYYDSCRQAFWTRNSRGEWIQFSEAALKRLLKYHTFPGVHEREALAQMIDKRLLDMQHEDDVAYAGAIAGYPIGLREVCGQRVLITSGPRLLKPKQGTWDTLETFVESMLGEQSRWFYGWTKSALRALYAGAPWRPGQMLAIAGPPGCGKSLLQNLLTEVFGGRCGKPYRYMIGDTAFNGELLQCEHLMIEDEAASTDIRVRRHFGSQLKNMIVNEVQSMHRKGRDALAVTPFWRVTISLNCEPENLTVLPPLDDSLRDKLTLLRAGPFVPPYAADDIDGRNKWRLALSAELPAFMHWLRQWKVPQGMVNVRYGVNAFQDIDLVQDLHETSPEFELLELIDSLQIWNADRDPFQGTAGELRDVLLEKDRHKRASNLLHSTKVAGTYLSRLCKHRPDRVTFISHRAKSQEYRVVPP